MRKIGIKVGMIYKSRSCGKFKVLAIESYKKMEVIFLETGYTCFAQGGAVTDGRISDKLSPTVYNIGTLGLVDHTVVGLKSYKIWSAMLQRCYSKKAQSRKRNSTYIDVSVCTEWLLYTTFRDWFDSNYKEGMYLDKDLTVLGSKVYSPITCSFMPNLVNCILWEGSSNKGDYPTGVHKDTQSGRFVAQLSVKGMDRLWLGYHQTWEEAHAKYKLHKEALVKEVATEYYEKGLICKTVYDNLYNWKV